MILLALLHKALSRELSIPRMLIRPEHMGPNQEIVINGIDSHDNLADLGTSPFVQETCTAKNASPQI